MKIYRIASWKDYDWTGVDWRKCDTWIAKQMGATTSAVAWARQNIAPDEYWDFASSIDWSKSNEHISKKTGLSLVGVQRMRTRVAPETNPYDPEKDPPFSGYRPRGQESWDRQLDTFFGLEENAYRNRIR